MQIRFIPAFLVATVLCAQQAPEVELTKQNSPDRPAEKKKVLINKIEAVVVGPEGNDIIDTFDIQRPGIDGRVRTLNDRIREREMYQDAKAMKLVEKEQVQKQLKSVQKEHNLTEDALKEIFKAGGCTYQEGIEQFEIMTAVNQITGFKVASKMIIPEKEVVAYCEQNPEMLEAEYQLSFASVPLYKADSTKELKEKLALHHVQVYWDEPFWIKQSEIAPEKKTVLTLNKGQTYISKGASGYELIKLVDKKDERPKPVSERYAEVERALQPTKYQQLFQGYLQELDDKMAVIRL